MDFYCFVVVFWNDMVSPGVVTVDGKAFAQFSMKLVNSFI